MGMVPKGDHANVRHIKSGGHAGGRLNSVTYDPETGEESGSRMYVGPTRDSATESNVFAVVESKGYDEHRFYCRSVNSDGHGEKLNVRVPQGIDSQMHAAVAEIPEYNHINDLIRDAVLHRLEFLQKRYSLGDGARRMLELERMQADSHKALEEVRSMISSLEMLDQTLKEHYDASDWQMFKDELERGDELAQWLREPYKARAAGIIKDWKLKAVDQLARLAKMNE